MMFTLKTKLKSERYPKGTCAASRCTEPSSVTDASGKHWPDTEVPLCDRHWERRCDIEGDGEAVSYE